MDIESYIQQGIFGENAQHQCFYSLIWETLDEAGFVITDEDGNEIDAVIKAVALKNLLGEFMYRLYDEVNEVGVDDILEHCQNLGFSQEDIIAYCEGEDNIELDDDDELTIKNALDYITEILADKMLEEFSADDLFDYMFTSTYAFEQDFVFDFDDYEELLAFVDTNQDQLDNYKDEYSSVVRWVESGMIC